VNLKQSPLPSELQQNRPNVSWLWISSITALIFASIEFVSLRMNGSNQFWTVLPIFIAAPFVFWLLRTDRHIPMGIILIAAIGLQSMLVPLVQSGLSIPNSITALVLIAGISLATVPRRSISRVHVLGLMVSSASVLIDMFGSSSRPLAAFGEVRWILTFTIMALFGAFFAREFLLLDLRTKIVTGILGTVGIALAILVIFAVYQSQEITNALSQRLDTSVSQFAEEQLINTVFVEASQANQEFKSIAEEVNGLAEIWLSLRSQEAALNQAPYWDARTNLIQLEGGQYGNKATDPSSVFIPVESRLDDALIADLNVSSHLDFSAPAVLQERLSLLAVYAIDTSGVTRYYPNIDLASILPPDFDATQRPYFLITSPLFNPQRLPRWTIPYVDAAGGGLVVTVAAPVYENEQFIGVVAADMRLDEITRQISSIKVGETGYAFMIDDAGRILSMPPAGFDMFGIHPEDMDREEFFKQTILGLGTDELNAVTRRMVAGGNGLLIVDIKGVDTYISFSPIQASGYSIALVVPVSELQGPIISARYQTEQQIRSAARVAATLLIILLVIAVAVSLGLGNIIAAPIQRLTQVASQISAGDLTVQAAAATSDEIGTLASAFNTMTSRLRETLDELEKRVEERTIELFSANEKNERRAKQFEAIAHIARTISSTRDLDVLLSQITTVINREFGFYHIGIFLLDAAKEYAVLSAANSEGGKNMLERGHRLKIGEIGLVGYVTGTGKPRVALDTGVDAIFFDNPDLPETRSELTLPLHVGEQIIGALDVQSTEPNAFLQEDINILSTLADQVSIAIQNAQQFEQTRKALNESEVLSRQFIQTGWQQFTKNRNLLGIRHTGARASILYRRNGKEQAEDLLSRDQSKANRRGASLSLPLKLHGEVIGSVDIRTPDNRPWDQDELDIVIAIIERAAIAMENARLLAESQKRAAKERTIGEISSKISMQSEINELLKTAALELGRTLPGAEIAIQFNKDTE
jgi:GAF domain-containing protein/HAMP domain-containing protein